MPKTTTKKMQFLKNETTDEADAMFENSPDASKHVKKRRLNTKEEAHTSKRSKQLSQSMEDGGAGGDFEGDLSVNSLLSTVGSGINKSMSAKKKRIENYSANIANISTSSIEEFVNDLTQSRKQVYDAFKTNISTLFEKFQTDVNAFKDQETKLTKLIQTQMKLIQKAITIQEEHLDNFHQLSGNFLKAMQSMESEQKDKICSFQVDLTSNLSKLQKKFQQELHQQELESVRKSLNKWI